MPVNSYQQPIQQGGIYFDLITSDQAAINYLVSPGNTVYLYNKQGQVLYEKTYDGLQIFDLKAREVQPQVANQNQNGLSREEIVQLIREELSAYNPHIPKKDRRQTR